MNTLNWVEMNNGGHFSGRNTVNQTFITYGDRVRKEQHLKISWRVVCTAR
jgi:hypothetical protein